MGDGEVRDGEVRGWVDGEVREWGGEGMGRWGMGR